MECLVAFMFHGLDPVACSEYESTYGTMTPFRRFVMSPWAGDQLVERSLPTMHRTTQKNAAIHLCFERDSKPRFQCSSLRLRDQWGQYMSEYC
jgi:hypothetical protein